MGEKKVIGENTIMRTQIGLLLNFKDPLHFILSLSLSLSPHVLSSRKTNCLEIWIL